MTQIPTPKYQYDILNQRSMVDRVVIKIQCVHHRPYRPMSDQRCREQFDGVIRCVFHRFRFSAEEMSDAMVRIDVQRRADQLIGDDFPQRVYEFAAPRRRQQPPVESNLQEVPPVMQPKRRGRAESRTGQRTVPIVAIIIFISISIFNIIIIIAKQLLRHRIASKKDDRRRTAFHKYRSLDQRLRVTVP